MAAQNQGTSSGTFPLDIVDTTPPQLPSPLFQILRPTPPQSPTVDPGSSNSSSHPYVPLPPQQSIEQDHSTSDQHMIRVSDNNGGSMDSIEGTHSHLSNQSITINQNPIVKSQQDDVHMPKQLPLSPQQCAMLMAVNSNGRSKYKDLCFPFDTNPNVEITFIQSSRRTVVEFHGKPDAVKAAFEYFETNVKSLNCQVDVRVQVNRLKWAALNEKKPQLLQTIRDKYGISLLYTNGHLTVQEDNLQGRGNMAAQQAIAEVEEQLSKCITCPLKPSLSPPLVTSLKFKLSKDLPSSIVFEHEGLQYLCSESGSENTKISEIVEHKLKKAIVYANTKIIETVKSDWKLYEKSFDGVEVDFQRRQIEINGFILNDVLAAKKILLDKVGKFKFTKRILSCSLPIKAYIHHILFERKMSAEHRTLLSSLSVKVITEDNTVYLEGSPGAIESEEKKLISELVPETFACEECEFSCNRKFIPQIEKSFLSPLHKNYDFTHLISCPSSEAADKDKKPHHKARHDKSRPSSVHGDHKKKRNQSESEDIGFTIMLFSTAGAQQFEKVISSIKELNPQTVRFQVPRGSIEYLQKKKSSLESKYHIWIFFSMPKGDSATVTLHGLRDCDVIECREDMEQSVFVTKKYYLDPHALLYLHTKCQNSIEELKNKCKTVSLPPVETDTRANNTATHKNPYILIKGKEADIDHVVKQLDSLVGPECFKVEMMSFKCLQCLSYHWKRWIERIPTDNGLVQVTLCKGPASVASQHSLAKSEVNALFNIEIFGSINDVDKIVKIVKDKQDASSIQSDVKISSRKRIQVQDLVKDAGISELKVWLSIRENKVLILAPSFAQDDLEKATSLIKDYLDETSFKTTTITCQSKLAFDIMLADRARYLGQVNEVGQRDHVRIQITSANRTITLSGTQPGLDRMQPLVQEAIAEAKRSISSKFIPVTSVQSPYLETNGFKEFCQEMRKHHQVEIGNGGCGENSVLIKACVGSLTVVVVKGDILAEDVDVIVNAANEDLEHIGGLAKAISDRAGPEVQKECSKYVKKHGKIPTGDVVCLGSGNLPFKNIIHAVAPRWYNGVNPTYIDQVLQSVVLKSIAAANKNGHSSIAIPALGTGIFRIPIKSFAKQVINAIGTFTHGLHGPLKEVRIVLDTDQACECVTNEIKQCQWLKIVDKDSSMNDLPLLDEISRRRPKSHKAFGFSQSDEQESSDAEGGEIKEWRWMNDSGQFQSYDDDTCARLTTIYQRNPSKSCKIVINGSIYEVNFEAMEQTNWTTKNKRKVKCVRSHQMSGRDDAEWFYKGDTLQWEPYLPNDSTQLEAWYQSGDLQPTESLQIGKFKYQFDLVQMTQTNARTKTVREIKRSMKISTENADSDDFSEGQAKWYFQNDSMEFQPYESSDSTQLEEWYQLSPSTPPGQLTISGNVYSFNFSSMKQTNVSTGKERKIKREGDDVHRNVKYESTTLKIQGNVKNMHHVMEQVQSKLDNCLSEESLDVPKSVRVAKVQRIAQKYPVKFDIVAPSKVKICGVQHVLQQCIDKVKTEMIASLEVASHQSPSQVKEPQEWQPQKETVELFSVMKGGQEWNKVSTKFMETLTSATISKIERIQNKWLWEKYSQHKQMLHKKNKGNVNEELLFHGTRGNDPTLIYDSEEGFDMRFSNAGMWGQANYFAVNSSYSDRYAYQNLSRDKQMFLAYVLTGDSHECNSDGSLKMPPEKTKPTYAQQTAGEVNLKQLRYDTVSGHTQGSKVFMTYDNLKAYPAYLITYQPAPPKRFGFF